MQTRHSYINTRLIILVFHSIYRTENKVFEESRIWGFRVFCVKWVQEVTVYLGLVTLLLEQGQVLLGIQTLGFPNTSPVSATPARSPTSPVHPLERSLEETVETVETVDPCG